MNQRNKPKLAIVIPEYKPLDRWYLWNDGLVGALRTLNKKYNIKVFGFCNTPSYITKNKFAVQLFNNNTSMRYWLKSFIPRYVIGYGDYGENWNSLLDNKYLEFDERVFVLGLNTRGIGRFITHTTIFATDTDYFKPLQANKLYPCVFTLPLDNLEQIPPGSLCVIKDGTDFQNVVTNHHLLHTAPKTPMLFNQAQGVITNDTETALEAMACNTPVLTTELDIEGCWKCPKDEIGQAYLQMVLSFENEDIDLRRKYVEHQADHIKLAERIKEVCSQ